MDTTGIYFDCLCRTCMVEQAEASSCDGNTKSQQQWQSIFDIIEEECGAFPISEFLTNAVPQIEVQPSDELPKRICSKCLQQLLSVHRFQQMCVQSEQQMRQQVFKKQTDPSIPTAAMKSETGKNDTDSYHFTNLQSGSTHQDLEHSSIQEPFLETTEQIVKPEAAETSNDDIDKLLEECRDSQGNLNEFVKNEPMDYDEPSIEYSDGESTHLAISVKDEVLCIESEEQQITETNVKAQRIKHDEDKPYECPYCPRRFKTKSNLAHHKTKHEGSERETCDICGKTFNKYWLKQHKLTHGGEKPHKCNLCEKSFARMSNLRAHIRRHTGEKPYKCKYCERFFSQNSDRMNHMRLHLGDNVHRCELCPLGFPVAPELRAHCITHKDEDPDTRDRNMKALKEAEAELELKAKGYVKAHHITHVENKPYECPYCSQSFSTHTHMLKHKGIHEGKNREACDICGKSISKRGLEEHKLTHGGEKVHKCDLCEKRFKKHHLIRGEDKHYECPHCPRRLTRRSSMYNHIAIHEGLKRDVCDICGKSFRKKNLKQHKLTHSNEKAHKCDFCEKRFTKISNLRVHIRIHTGEKPYKCKYCERSYSDPSHRIKHMRVHLGDNVHRCELCPLAFPILSELREHFTTHKNEDPETRERNMKALEESEAELELKSKEQNTKRS